MEKIWIQAHLKMLSKNVLKITYLIYMHKNGFCIKCNGWYAIQPNQTESYIYLLYMYKEDLALNNL